MIILSNMVTMTMFYFKRLQHEINSNQLVLSVMFCLYVVGLDPKHLVSLHVSK